MGLAALFYERVLPIGGKSFTLAVFTLETDPGLDGLSFC